MVKLLGEVDCDALSVNWIVNDEVAAVVGVPEIVPVEELSDKPEGSVPKAAQV